MRVNASRIAAEWTATARFCRSLKKQSPGRLWRLSALRAQAIAACACSRTAPYVILRLGDFAKRAGLGVHPPGQFDQRIVRRGHRAGTAVVKLAAARRVL